MAHVGWRERFRTQDAGVIEPVQNLILALGRPPDRLPIRLRGLLVLQVQADQFFAGLRGPMMPNPVLKGASRAVMKQGLS